MVELRVPIQAASSAYFCKLSLIRCRDINWRVRITLGLYKTLIHSILLNGSEARTFSEQAVEKIHLFEGKIHLKILGPSPLLRSVESQMQGQLFELHKDILPSAKLWSEEET